MDVAAVRAHIKQWEHAFKADHGREPTVQDIKDEPAIAEQYRLYKRLNKARHSSASSSAQPSAIPPKSRAVKSAAPLLSVNPFSPVKHKGKSRDRSLSPPDRPNPFATPGKDKARPRFPGHRDPSPDLFPLIPALHPPPQSTSSHPLPGTAGEKTAVSRARKRLRGEPVSPSPVKEKRARVVPQPSLTFAKYSTLNDSDNNDDAPGSVQAHDSDPDEPFFDDSPVKQPTGAKAYTPLFEEAAQPHVFSKRSITRSHSKLATAVPASATRSRAISPASDDDDEDWLQKGKIKALDFSMQSNRKAGKQMPANTALSAGPSRATNGRPLTHLSPADVPSSSTEQPSLLPPSPPPKVNKSTKPKYIDKSKGKGKAASRKKAKQSDGDDEESDYPEDEDMNVEIVPLKRPATQSHDEALVEDWNRVLSLAKQRHGNSSPVGEDPGEVEISLPDELKHVLDISIDDTKVRDTTEQILAKQLIYGSRVMQYDARKGGEIWDVGEEEEPDVRAVGDEDEWEGEPVPWEVGEL